MSATALPLARRLLSTRPVSYVGAVARIAGMLHLAEYGAERGPTTPVSAQTIVAAHRIGVYFKACAINAFSQMGADRLAADAAYLLERISRLGLDEVSERDMHVATRPRLRTKDDLIPAVQRLVDHGYLAKVPGKPSKERGRPASPRYKVWDVLPTPRSPYSTSGCAVRPASMRSRAIRQRSSWLSRPTRAAGGRPAPGEYGLRTGSISPSIYSNF
jgi:hypothetical protein